jgi:hypothetical protein
MPGGRSAIGCGIGAAALAATAFPRLMVGFRRPVKAKAYHLYGGAGIRVFERWLVLSNFLVDMGEPTPRQTLGRLDNRRLRARSSGLAVAGLAPGPLCPSFLHIRTNSLRRCPRGCGPSAPRDFLWWQKTSPIAGEVRRHHVGAAQKNPRTRGAACGGILPRTRRCRPSMEKAGN